MSNRAILKAAALAALFLIAGISDWLCFGSTDKSDPAVEIAAPIRADNTHEPSPMKKQKEPAKEPAEEEDLFSDL